MPFVDIIGNTDIGNFLKKDLSLKKDSGTYLFIGRRGINLEEWAVSFAKGLVCEELENDYCGKCRTCRNIDKGIYSDLHFVDSGENAMKVEQARELIKVASTSAYEGNRKIFIIKRADLFRKESANAILKTIEEPLKGNFFILLSNDKNILPTIKSRSTELYFKPVKRDEMDLSDGVYDFFEGNTEDLLNISKIDYNFDKKIDYKSIGALLEEYIENKDIETKADLIKTVEDFVEKKDYLSDIAKISLAEDLDKILKNNKELLKEILSFFILKLRRSQNIEHLLEFKEKLFYNVNIKLLLYNFFLNI